MDALIKFALILLMLGALGAIYFLPAINAYIQKHRNWEAIFVLNLFLGWTILGWIIALVWSALKPPIPHR